MLNFAEDVILSGKLRGGYANPAIGCDIVFVCEFFRQKCGYFGAIVERSTLTYLPWCHIASILFFFLREKHSGFIPKE